MINARQDPNCSCAKAVEFEGETVYECTEPECPCYQGLCNLDMCCPQDDLENDAECIFKDYYGNCGNDDCYNHGDYCPGHCDSFESK